jgi:hypothetical protein
LGRGRLTARWAFRLDGVVDLLPGDGLGEDGGGREGEDEEQLHFSEEWPGGSFGN